MDNIYNVSFARTPTSSQLSKKRTAERLKQEKLNGVRYCNVSCRHPEYSEMGANELVYSPKPKSLIITLTNL